ncbi:hypothetical protein V6Z12_D11G148600, partial [Gossypium hirsutum]
LWIASLRLQLANNSAILLYHLLLLIVLFTHTHTQSLTACLVHCFPPSACVFPLCSGPTRKRLFGSLFSHSLRIGYSPITLIARNRHYAPSVPITHSASFYFFFSFFCPHPQRSDSPTLPCTGWGVRAGEPILSGTFVCEYVGEILGEQEANNRLTRYGRDGCNYMFNIGSQINDMSRWIEGQARYFIDASNYKNVSRFINHSCSPNLVNLQVLVDNMDCHRAHIGLYASQDISVGEELTFDYRYELLPGQGYSCRLMFPNMLECNAV